MYSNLEDLKVLLIGNIILTNKIYLSIGGNLC